MNKRTLILSFKLLVLFVISVFVTGCAISNEGATDYRYIDHHSSNKQKYIKPKDTEPLHPFKPGDALQISLKQVFINDFVEWRSPMRWVRLEPANGEIAIVVNAFEKGKGGTADFSPDGQKNARVVFFSDDVWEGQFLNLSNLSTIYGPLKYDGGPFILDLYIVEMDTPGEQLKQLMSNLAAIGSTFYPPAAPIAGPLATLAGTLIKDDQDDRAYHYTAEFKPLGGDSDLNTGLLLPGDYVFVREEDRHETTNWNNLSFDEKNGRIVYKPDVPGKSDCTKPDTDKDYPSHCYYRENSYVVVEINTAASSLENDRKQMIYTELSSKVFSNAASIFKGPLPGNELEAIAIEVEKTRSADIINKQLRILESTSSSPVAKKTALDKFIHLWSTKEKGDPKKPKFTLTEEDQQRIETRLGTIISGCESDTNKVIILMNKLRNRSAFNTQNSSDVIKALYCPSSNSI